MVIIIIRIGLYKFFCIAFVRFFSGVKIEILGTKYLRRRKTYI